MIKANANEATDLTNFWRYSANGSVSFQARRLRNPRLVWINLKWFSAQGVAVEDEGQLAALKSKVLRDYAFIVPRPEDHEEAFDAEWRTFFADRYGEMGLVAHGGSGRAGSWMDLQIKGIGITPLVGKNADWLHAHGCAWMEEAIREVIYSQLYDAEFPYGTVPVVAIIDTGLHAEMPKGHIGERRALIVRPSVFRVSHLLRATFYEPRMGARIEQQRDAARTEDAIHLYTALSKDSRGGDILNLQEINQAAAESIAFGEIFRLWSGGVTASTLSLQGQLIDFGGARALPDWRRAEVAYGLPPFGGDASAWITMLGTLCYLLTKHGQPSEVAVQREIFVHAYHAALQKNILKFWGVVDFALLPEEIDNLVQLTMAIFRSQQKESVSYLTGDPYGRDWIYDDLFKVYRGLPAAGRHKDKLLNIWYALSQIALRVPHKASNPHSILLPALRHSCPRHTVFREGLQKGLFADVVPSSPQQQMREGAVDDIITTCLSSSRRFFPSYLHEHVASIYDDGSCTIVHIDRMGEDSEVCIKARKFGQSIKFGRHFIPIYAIDHFCTFTDDLTWQGKVPVKALQNGKVYLETPNFCVAVGLSSWMLHGSID